MNSSTLKSVGCVIMASGLGKRFGGNKLMANLDNKPIIQWILDTTKDLFKYRIVVTRNLEVKKLCEENNVDVIFHELPERSDTVRLGLSPLATKVDACFFMPADQPFITRDSMIKLIRAVQGDVNFIWRSAYKDIVGSPVCFPKWTFTELLELPQGKGGSFVVNKYKDKVKTIQVSDEIELMDIDTKDDYQKAVVYLKNL